MTKTVYSLLALAALSVTPLAAAQEDGSQIILPVEAQSCDLPSAPARIPDEASYDDLVKAKGNINTFQAELLTYRECLDASRTEDITDGNEIALTQAFNYSVEMEERVAEQFNVAVREYKARQAESEG